MKLTLRELGTVLAGLRMVQRAENLTKHIAQIANSGGEINPLTLDEIEDLAQRINTEEVVKEESK